MRLDPELWSTLEAHGVSVEHMTMLLRLLETQRNGSWSWHYVSGRLQQCEARLVLPSREHEIARVCAALFDDNSLPR